jgi:hypothetical protein
MKTIKKSTKRVIYPLLLILLSGVVIFNVIRITSPEKGNRVVAYRVENGWGYRIMQGDRVAIDQPFIPLLPGKTSFPTKRSAIKTGKIVLGRLQKQQVPVLTFDDLRKLHLFP